MIKLSYEMPADHHLPIAFKRLSVQCSVQIGSASPGRASLEFRYPAITGIALVNTGSSVCLIGPRMVPRGSVPIAIRKGASNISGAEEKKAVYRCRLMFFGHPTMIELDCIRQDSGDIGCDLALGTPFLSLGRLLYDAANGESHFKIHTE